MQSLIMPPSYQCVYGNARKSYPGGLSLAWIQGIGLGLELNPNGIINLYYPYGRYQCEEWVLGLKEEAIDSRWRCSVARTSDFFKKSQKTRFLYALNFGSVEVLCRLSSSHFQCNGIEFLSSKWFQPEVLWEQGRLISCSPGRFPGEGGI